MPYKLLICIDWTYKYLFSHYAFVFSYNLRGEKIDYFPGSVTDLAQVEVNYIAMPGWLKSTENVRDFNELPPEAQDYVRMIENELGVPVKWIGVGKGRESIINVEE